MKNIFKILFVFTLFTFLNIKASAQNKQELSHFTNLEDAKVKAKETGKPLFIFVHRKGCGRCASTWIAINGNRTLQEKLKKDVVFVKVNTDSQAGSDAYFMIRDSGGSYSLPLMGIVDVKSKKVFAESEGYKNAEAITTMLSKIKK